MTPATTTTTTKGHAIYLGLGPWVLFTLLVEHGGLKVAALVALVAAAVISLPGLRSGRPKTLELGAVATFAAFAALAFTADAQVADWTAHYARIAAGVLAMIATGSLAFTPFTEQYARESVPERFWGSPEFEATNHALSSMWALVFTAMVPLHVAAGAIDTVQGNALLNWALPIALIVWAAKRTAAASDDAPQPAIA
jgi:hypothetical protein